jgi:glycosyltransferase involved in cell wall biosynthesis
MKGKTRVMRVIARLNIGGPAIHTILLAAGLDAARFESTLVTGVEAACEGNMLDLAAQKGVQPLIIPELGREINPLKDWVTLLKLYRLFRDQRPHIVHTHTAKAGTVGRLAARLAGVPIVVHTFHGHVFHDYFGPLQTKVFIGIERFLASLSDRIVTVSEGQRQELAAYGVASLDKIAVVPLGFELDALLNCESLRGQLRRELGIPEEMALVGIVARLAAIKNHRLFLDAARLIVEAGQGAMFLVVGDGELRAELEAYAAALGLAERVIFTGWRRDLPRIYADLDVVALSSLNEGTPVSLIEAMAAAKPVVATRVGGVSDVILDKESGYLVQSKDAEGLARGILDLLRAPDRAREMGLAGRVAVHPKYASETLLANIEKLYLQLLACTATVVEERG